MQPIPFHVAAEDLHKKLGDVACPQEGLKQLFRLGEKKDDPGTPATPASRDLGRPPGVEHVSAATTRIEVDRPRPWIPARGPE